MAMLNNQMVISGKEPFPFCGLWNWVCSHRQGKWKSDEFASMKISAWDPVIVLLENATARKASNFQQKNQYGYGSIPITIFRGMNIHKSQLWLGVHQGYYWFWLIAIWNGESQSPQSPFAYDSLLALCIDSCKAPPKEIWTIHIIISDVLLHCRKLFRIISYYIIQY